MKKLTDLLFSISTAGFLLLVFALALAIATFVENSYGSEAARAIVYNSWWLEVILLILAINLLSNVLKYKLYRKQKLTMGIFHLALILILLGAGLTRYFGYEGVMHIREGESSSIMVSQEPWFHLNAELDSEKKGLEQKFMISSMLKDQISGNITIGDKKISVKSVDYLPQAQQSIEPVKDGTPIIEIVYPVGGEMQTEFLQNGKIIRINGATLGYGVDAQVQFSNSADTLKMISKDTISTIDMSGKNGPSYLPGKVFVGLEKIIYKVGNSAFVIKQFLPSADLVAVPSNGVQTGLGAVKIQLSDNQKQEEVTILTNSESQGPRYESTFEGIKIRMWIGPKEIILPFSIALKKFVLERYPGSNSPSSYESMVTLTDKGQGVNKDYRIFMNNVLKHRGYRFYQSSYDQDEKGTILSVNKDPLGTSTTYLGYFFLFLGIILSIFNPSSFFFKLMKKISAGTEELKNEGVKELKNKGIKGLLILCLLSSFSAESATPTEVPSSVANEFSKVWVQGHDGRIKPFTTLAYEIVMKVSRSERLFGQNPEQVVLGMAERPHDWQQITMIAINDAQLEAKLGIKGDNASFADFFDSQGNYKLARDIQSAYARSPGARGKYDNSVIKVDERLNVVYQLYNGEIFRFFPSPDRKDETWYAQDSKLPLTISSDSLFIRTSFKNFLEVLNNNNTSQALNILTSIKDYQQKYGSKLIPDKSKGNLEIMYNHVNIFKYLSIWYILLGLGLLSLFFHSLFTGKPLRKFAVGLIVLGLFVGFLAQCTGLIVRGYISGHMPWSNGYESMIYIGWAAMFAGLIFARRNPMVLGAAAILSALTLFVAQMSWLNPELTNLVPVLKSYWLTIHVAIITASYGFLGVSAIIGLLNLVMAGFQSKSSRERLNQTIVHMTAINQAAMILGLYFLTIGTFLGGIWANESWGRYWGWDPKETWSLITILVYTFITHMRLIKGFRGWYAVNLGSLIGMVSVLMTYLGVNYYLSGLHSYGSGEGLQFPLILLVVFIIIGIIAFIAKKRGIEFKKEIELQE
jgi:cytochrome c-type biogenesis protein CcsB